MNVWKDMKRRNTFEIKEKNLSEEEKTRLEAYKIVLGAKAGPENFQFPDMKDLKYNLHYIRMNKVIMNS